MGTKELSVGRAERVENGHPRKVWQVLELRESEALEGVDGLPPQPGWVQVPGTADFESKEDAESAMKRLQNLPE